MSFIIIFSYQVFPKWRLNWICRWRVLNVKAVTLLLTWMPLKRHIYCKRTDVYNIREQKDVGPLPGSVWVSCPSCTPTLFWATFSDSWETGLTPPVFLVHNGSGAVRAGYRTRYPYGYLVQNHNIVGISSMFWMALIICASYRDCCMAISLFYIQGVFWESQARLLTAAEGWSRGFHKLRSWQAALRADESSISHLIVMHSQLIKKTALGKLYSE